MPTQRRNFLAFLKGLLGAPDRIPVSPGASVSRSEPSSNPGGVFLEATPEWFERQYAKGSRSRGADAYFSLLDPLDEAIRSGDYATAIRCAKESVPLLQDLIRWERKEHDGFDITYIPAIYPAGRIMAAMGDSAGLRAIEAEVARHEELRPWAAVATEMLRDISIVERILAMVAEKPGLLQKDLRKTIEIEPERVRELCYWMAKGNRIRREKSGSSYKLFAPGS